MSTINEAVINSLIKRTQTVLKKSEEEFGSLTAAQLNKKPAPDKWSIGQVFDHLIIYNSTYYPIYEKVATGRHHMTLWQKINPLSHLTGSFLLKVLRSDTKKVKALKSFRPSESNIPPGIINDFVQNTNILLKYFSQIKEEDVDVNKTIVQSPAGSIFTYTLKDSMDISVTHMERHLKQAERGLKSL
ncbi:MAG: DinB family protein [Ignavibacteria bacterium]|nr:DinB family protein [Ignavibacteria bacterium]